MVENNKNRPVVITQFKWAGKLGPLRIQTHCDQCDLNTAILQNMMDNEFKDKNVALEIKPWLDHLFYCLLRGTWHAPIIIVNDKKFYQFREKEPFFDRKKLASLVENYLKQ